jgi:DNA-binding NtrC family response regulator
MIVPTVLVVDDEMLIRWAVAESLVAAGFVVVQAGSAAEALARLAGRIAPVAVALLDLRLPDSTDFGLLRRVIALDPACRVILMTADGTPGVLEDAIRAGAFGALAKPFDLHVVTTLVRQAAAARALDVETSALHSGRSS